MTNVTLNNNHRELADLTTVATVDNDKRPLPSGNGAPHASEDSGARQGTEHSNPSRQRILTAIGAAVLLGATIGGVKYFQYSGTHVSTDDAYVTGNIVNVSPIIPGTLSQLTVQEGDTVVRGQLIAKLEDSGERAAVSQAQHAYVAAETEIPQAETEVAFLQATTNAAIQRAEAAMQSQYARTDGARVMVTMTAQTTTNQVAQAEQQAAAATAQAAQADAQVEAARAAVEAARKSVATAEPGAQAAVASIGAAQASYDRAHADGARYAALLKHDAVTPQQYDLAQAADRSAQSQLDAAKDQAAQAQAQVEVQEATVQQAEGQLAATEKAATVAHRQIQVAMASLGVARAGLGQVPIQENNLTSSLGSNTQAQADLATALAGRQQVREKQQEIETLKAQALQAKAALENAQVQLNHTLIYAPSDGMVVNKGANVGAALSPGQTIVTMSWGHDVWVTANFKETQLANVRPGEDAEVKVDAFPGKLFRGKVQSVICTTGSSVALLPADNATGNFTKVVQRVPIRITLIPSTQGGHWASASDISRLPQGGSVTATIDTK